MEMLFRQRRGMTSAALGLAGVLALSGCSERGEIMPGEAGTVMSHEYDDPDTTWTTIGSISYPTTHPERFLLHLRRCGYSPDRYSNADEKGCIMQEVEVPKAVYDSTFDGATFVVPAPQEAK